MSEKTVHTFKKNTQEQVRAGITEYKGKPYIFLRIFFRDDEDVWRPTKKGLTLAPALLGELGKALAALKQAV